MTFRQTIQRGKNLYLFLILAVWGFRFFRIKNVWALKYSRRMYRDGDRVLLKVRWKKKKPECYRVIPGEWWVVTLYAAWMQVQQIVCVHRSVGMRRRRRQKETAAAAVYDDNIIVYVPRLRRSEFSCFRSWFDIYLDAGGGGELCHPLHVPTSVHRAAAASVETCLGLGFRTNLIGRSRKCLRPRTRISFTRNT